MAQNVEYVVKAKDDASVVLSNVFRQFQGIESTIGKISSIASGAGAIGMVVGTIAGTTAALLAAGTAVADTVEQLDRLERITGISTDKLQVIKRVIKDGGGDAEGFSTSLVKLNRALQDGDPLLAKIGVTSGDTFTAFMQVARAITQAADAKERDEIATRLLGKAGAELIPDLENMLTKFDSTYAAMDRVGGLLGGQVADQARNLDSQMESLAGNWEAAMTRMKSSAVPAAAGIVSAFNDIWDAISGADKNPTAIDVQRRLTEAETTVRTLLAEQNKHGGADWNKTSFDQATALAERLRQQLATLQGADLELQRLRSKLEPSKVQKRLLTDDPNEKKQRHPTLAEFSEADDRRQLGIFNQLEGTDFSLEEVRAAAKSLSDYAKSLDQVAVTGTRLQESEERLEEIHKRVSAALDAASVRMQFAVAGNIQNAIHQLTHGADSIRAVFNQLTQGILADIAEAAASYGIGLGLQLLGLVPGFGWAGPIGGAIAGTDAIGDNALAPAGGDTYYISTLNSKDLIQQLTSPSGQLRRANDRIRDVARAQRR